MVCAHIHGCITDSEYGKILHRFQTKILLKNIEPRESEVHCIHTDSEIAKSFIEDVESVKDLLSINDVSLADYIKENYIDKKSGKCKDCKRY